MACSPSPCPEQEKKSNYTKVGQGWVKEGVEQWERGRKSKGQAVGEEPSSSLILNSIKHLSPAIA